jgi:hypothetical protein
VASRTEAGGAGRDSDVPAAGGLRSLLGGQPGPSSRRFAECLGATGDRRRQRLRSQREWRHVVAVVHGAGHDLERRTPRQITFVEIGCHMPHQFEAYRKLSLKK